MHVWLYTNNIGECLLLCSALLPLGSKWLSQFSLDSNLMFMRINDIAIAMSYSSRADPGLRVAFKYLNV